MTVVGRVPYQAPVVLFLVTCPDGERRHPEPFKTHEAAEKFAHWGCICRTPHYITEMALEPSLPGLERA